MARPKTGKPRKKNLTLTVDEPTRLQLEMLSLYRQQSISALVAKWADEDAQRLSQELQHVEKNQKYMDAIRASVASGKADEMLTSEKARALMKILQQA